MAGWAGSSVEIQAIRERKLVEIAGMMTSEPGQVYSQVMKLEHQIPAGMMQEFVQIIDRPNVDPQIWASAKQKLDEQGVSTKVEIGAYYDPLSPLAELSNLTQFVKFHELVQARLLRELRQFGCMALLGGLFGVLLGGSVGMEFMKIMAIVFLTWKLTKFSVQLVALGQFGMAELGRLRFSVTAGNLVQLLMRIEEKLNYVERRSSSPRDSCGVPSEFQRIVGVSQKIRWDSERTSQGSLGNSTVGPCSSSGTMATSIACSRSRSSRRSGHLNMQESRGSGTSPGTSWRRRRSSEDLARTLRSS